MSMTAHEVVQLIRDDIEDQRKRSVEAIPIENLHGYLGAVANQIDEADRLATSKAATDSRLVELQHQSNLEHYQAERDNDLEMFRSVISSGHSPLKSSNKTEKKSEG